MKIRTKFLNSLKYPLRLDWKKITLPDEYIFLNNAGKKDEFLKRALYAVVKFEPKIPFNVKTDVLIIKSLIRNDYNEFVNLVSGACDLSNRVVDIEYSKRGRPSILLLLKIIYYLPVFFRIVSLNIKLSFYKYLKAIMYISVWKIFTQYHFNTIVAFADMQAVENMLIQYFNKKGKNTITLQHGLYVDYSNYDNINKINYLNVVSKYFLAWGMETKQLLQSYHPELSVHICGKPLFFHKYTSPADYFSLVFDQLLFTEQNKQLLEMAYTISKKMNIKVNVRIHPWDKKEKYSFLPDLTLFGEDINSSRFVIGHTTSMVFECMRNGIPAFKYKTRFPSNVINDDLTFSNLEELFLRIENIDKYNFKELGKYYLEFVGDESLQRYTEFFNSLNHK